MGNHSIFEVAPGGNVSTFVGPEAGLSGPFGLAFDDLGNLYVANHYDSSVVKIDPLGEVTTVATGLNGPTFLTWQPTPIPEPATCGLAMAVVMGLAVLLRRRKR